MNMTRTFDICIGDVWNEASKKNSLINYNLAIENTDYLSAPLMETHYIEIPYGETIDLSTALTGEPIFKSREINLKVGTTTSADNWTTYITNLRNELHGQRVCISFDDDDGFFYNGRLTIENFSAKRDLGTFEIKIICKPYKCSKITESLSFSYTGSVPASKGVRWDEAVTSNTTYTDETIENARVYVNDQSLDVPQDVLNAFDFDGDGRINQNDLDIGIYAKECYLFADLPARMKKHAPVIIEKGVTTLTELITYTVPPSAKNYTVYTNDLYPSINKQNKNFVVYLLKKDGTTIYYNVLRQSALKIPFIFGDTAENEYIGIKIAVRNWRSNWQAGETWQHEIGKDEQGEPIYESRTVVQNETNVDKTIYMNVTERSL